MADLTKGTHKQRSKFLVKLRNEYRSIPSKDRDTPEAKELSVEINDLDQELKGIGSSLGASTRNHKWQYE